MKLKGARIIITGAGGGIGSEVVQKLAAQGARLALLGRDESALQQVVDKVEGASSKLLLFPV
ncbi:MAG: SDR family NAD(P)-dependent oxidoreductase, partial [Candidatus Thiodiazotropha sp. 6PLUC4]